MLLYSKMNNSTTNKYSGLSTMGDLMEMRTAEPPQRHLPHSHGMARRLKERRLELGLSQGDLAALCDVSKGSISQWESGVTDNIGLQSFLKLLDALETDFQTLVFGPEVPGQQQRRRR